EMKALQFVAAFAIIYVATPVKVSDDDPATWLREIFGPAPGAPPPPGEAAAAPAAPADRAVARATRTWRSELQ
ncbi:unnamed protein product, partial [Prorocentrum cordatum]